MLHYLAVKYMLHHLATNSCSGDWSLIGGCATVTFLEDWSDVCCPVIRNITSIQGSCKDQT